PLHVERLLELLHELGEVEQVHLLERVKEVFSADLRHGGVFLVPSIPSVWSGQPSSPEPGVSGGGSELVASELVASELVAPELVAPELAGAASAVPASAGPVSSAAARLARSA